MMTKSWRRLAEALGPGMIDLKKFKDMDAQQGRPIPTGGPTRPPMQMPGPPQTDHGLEDPEWLAGEMEDESAFSQLSHELDKQPGVTDPDALAASIGRKKYGAAGMAAKSAAGRKR